jgi:hypothetical protein
MEQIAGTLNRVVPGAVAVKRFENLASGVAMLEQIAAGV